MTDRVPGAPGQYRAVITQAEMEKLRSGETFIITLTRDDQPVTQGTPYSKAAVLPDELAAKICPNVQDPAPKDAFEALANKHKCFGSLKDIGITDFPTTMSAVAEAMPANSMIIIDTREITLIDNGEKTHAPKEEISDWGNDTNGTAYISKGRNVARVGLMILYGSSTSIYGRLMVGNWAMETNTTNWMDYGYEAYEDYPGCVARKSNGVVEWVNPPMELGVSYRTQKRHKGKAVYTKMINFGTLPNAGSSSIEHRIANVESIVSCTGTMSSGACLPYTGADFRVDCQATIDKITVKATNDLSKYTAVIVIEYTTSTD